MLFTYTYVPHQMEKMQTFIDFIFLDVWCKAPIGLDFSPNLFERNLDLRDILSYFGFVANAPERGKRFYKDIKEIYRLFATLAPEHVDQFKAWYKANNDIEKACANDPTINMVRYKHVFSAHPTLGKLLASFFCGLYDKSLLGLVSLREKIGKIEEHNTAFFSANKIGKCPFCGLSDLKGIHHTRREAYDHYLPKFRYPFNSINFRNLVPACHECNSSYKLSKDPAHNAAGRRKAFYPYSNAAITIEISVAFQILDINLLTPADIQLTFGPSSVHEEIETWREVYGIDERYKAKLCAENDGKYWVFQILEEWQVDDRSPTDFLKTLTRQEKQNSFADTNFLKKAFLEGCDRAGIFDAARVAKSS